MTMTSGNFQEIVKPIYKGGRMTKSEAMRHSNILGAGAKKRKHLKGQAKVGVVMSEFKRGTLHSGSGDIVRNPKQAIAIALSEAGMEKKYKEFFAGLYRKTMNAYFKWNT